MSRIRIVTINTAKGDFDYSSRLPWLSHSLRELQPDIVLLQESLATLDGELDTARTLTSGLQFEYVYAPARRKSRLVDGRDRDSYSGLAVLSRFPIAESVVVQLPADVADGERIGLLVRIAIGDQRFLLVNVHLTHLSGSDVAATRRAEFVKLLSHPWFLTPGDVALVGGDFNTSLSELATVIDEQTGFDVRDSWGVGGGSGSRATVPVYISPEDSRGRCLDYLLSVAVLGVAHPAFEDSAIVLGGAAADGRYPSDHRGIATSLLLNGTTEK